MSLHITTDMLEHAYDFMRASEPFVQWGMPEADDIEFHVITTKKLRGHCIQKARHHVIGISNGVCGHTLTLFMAMGHEMVHVYLDRCGVKPAHGKDFLRCAAMVCEVHGFDTKFF